MCKYNGLWGCNAAFFYDIFQQMARKYIKLMKVDFKKRARNFEGNTFNEYCTVHGKSADMSVTHSCTVGGGMQLYVVCNGPTH